MKILRKGSLIVATGAIITLGLGGLVLAATTTVNMGTANNFSVLAGTAITNATTSTISGNIGLSPSAGSNITGLTAADVSGKIYAADATGPAGSISNPGLMTTAKNDLTTAYLDAAGRTPTNTYVTTDNQLGGLTLTDGVYRFPHATTANLTAANPLVLDGQNDPNSVFIFQATSDLVTASGSTVSLINGAQACNVFWQVSSSATLGSGSTFVGNILALTSITATTGTNINGKLLARNGAVVLQSNTISGATCAANGTPLVTDTTTVPSLPNTGTSITDYKALWTVIALGLAATMTTFYALTLSQKKHTK